MERAGGDGGGAGIAIGAGEGEDVIARLGERARARDGTGDAQVPGGGIPSGRAAEHDTRIRDGLKIRGIVSDDTTGREGEGRAAKHEGIGPGVERDTESRPRRIGIRGETSGTSKLQRGRGRAVGCGAPCPVGAVAPIVIRSLAIPDESCGGSRRAEEGHDGGGREQLCHSFKIWLGHSRMVGLSARPLFAELMDFASTLFRQDHSLSTTPIAVYYLNR